MGGSAEHASQRHRPRRDPWKGPQGLLESLHRDWLQVAEHPAGPWTWSTEVEPGPIALRARWQYLRDLAPGAAVVDAAAHRISIERWRRDIEVETAGDAALVAHDISGAREAFIRLRDDASHPVVQVQAAIGLADVLRYEDINFDKIYAAYSEAVGLAEGCGFAFGATRARLPLAYLVRRNGSAEHMLQIATDCETAARGSNDRMYVANALVARGEALDLLGHVAGNRDRAVEVLNQSDATAGCPRSASNDRVSEMRRGGPEPNPVRGRPTAPRCALMGSASLPDDHG